MRNSHIGIPYSVLSLILIFTMLTATACEPTVYFEVTNQTDEALLIYLDYILRGEVAPGDTARISFGYIGLQNTRLVAKNKQGEVIYSENMTQRELATKKHIISKSPK